MRERRWAAINRTERDGIQIKGPQQEDKGDIKENGNRGYIDQGPADGGEGRQ